jgi:protein-tyrosine phosphatase
MRTKQVAIGDKVYTIKRITLGERRELSKAAEDPILFQATMIYYAVESPKFQSVEDVLKLDEDTANWLYLEILDFNSPGPDFLSRLQKFLDQARQASQILRPFNTSTMSSPG